MAKSKSGYLPGELEFQRIIEEKREALATKHVVKRNRVGLDVMVRNQHFLSVLADLTRKNPLPKALPYRGKKSKRPERILNLMLSDLHYGSDLKAAECLDDYGRVEEGRRTAGVVTATADWKRQYRKDTVLYVHLLGDIIDGKLHDPAANAPLAEQFDRACWNLGQALRFLASEFQEVKVFAVPGNHGRRKDRHPDRAVNQKWDSIENMIYSSLKLQMASAAPNVNINIPLTPFYTYQAFDKRGFMTHGDTVLNVGFPGKTIAVENIRRQINEINAREHCHLFGAGHVHVASTVRIPSGPVLITNGCLTPSGEYGQSLGMMDITCCQQIWESVPGIVCGHRMEILVDEHTDADTGLDRVILPYQGYGAGDLRGRGRRP